MASADKPTELLFDQRIIGIAPANAGRAFEVLFADFLACNFRHHVNELIDRHHFIGTDIHGAGKIGIPR